MNGVDSNLPSGAMLSSIPDSVASGGSIPEYVPGINGVAEGAEVLSNPPGPPENEDSISTLKRQLSLQLEYYFSRENLTNDAYLLSQMDSDQYVPIWTVANFNQVKKLTSDISLITEVLRESPNLQVDAEGCKVRPNHKRCIVILREIPALTPKEEVENLFLNENCPKFISCEFAHNNSWFVTFDTDEDAQRAYRYLREEVKEFLNRPIMARIKAKPMNRLPNLPPIKNGFRAPTQATATPSTYDANAATASAPYPPGQQRFIFANGSTSNFSNHIPVYGPPYQQHQYFVQWPPSTAPYYDINQVFQINGLAPQQFKSQPFRSNTRPRKQNRTSNTESSNSSSTNQGNSSRQANAPPSVSPQGTSRTAIASNGTRSTVANDRIRNTLQSGILEVEDSHLSNNVQQPLTATSDVEDSAYRSLPTTTIHQNKDPLPPRHRRKRKEDDNINVNHATQPRDHTGSRGQFEFIGAAFPPLQRKETLVKPGQVGNLGLDVVNQQSLPFLPNNSSDAHSQNLWGDNRLADVVKGTVKSKHNTREVSSGPDSDSPRTGSPQNPALLVIHKSDLKEPINVALTQVPVLTNSSPLSIEKLTSQVASKCTMSDKSTKTDDAFVNGELDSNCPTTTNAATMTNSIVTEAPTKPVQAHMVQNTSARAPSTAPSKQENICQDNPKQATTPPPPEFVINPPRMSYAQVAQNQKETQTQKENSVGEQTNQSNKQTDKNSVAIGRIQNDKETSKNGNQSKEVNHPRDTNHSREGSGQNRHGQSRNGHRSGAQRRRSDQRTSQLRDFVPSRSPK